MKDGSVLVGMTGCRPKRKRCRLCHAEIRIEMLAKPGAKKNRFGSKRFSYPARKDV